MTSQDVAGFQGFTGVLSVNVHASCRPLRVSCPFASAVFGLNHPTDLSVAIHASVRAPSVGMSGPGFGEEEVSAVHATGFYRFLVLLLAQSDSQVGRGGGEVRGRAWQKRAVSLNAFKFG